MKRFRSFAAGLTACLLLSGCQSVYLHDEGLKTSTAKAHEALAGVTPLKPFDDQLANLEAFAQREDQGVAEYWTAVRDAHFDGVLLPDTKNRESRMRTNIDKRLAILVGPGPTDKTLARVRTLIDSRAQALKNKGVAERLVANNLREYLRVKAEEDAAARDAARAEGRRTGAKPAVTAAAPDLSCEPLSRTPAAEIERINGRSRAQTSLVNLILSCRRLEQVKQGGFSVTQDFPPPGGVLRALAEAADAAEAKTEPKLSNRAERLREEIERAKQFTEENSGVAQLAALRDDIRDLLGDADEATQFAGWEEADTIVEDLLRAEICDVHKDKVDEKTRSDAKCGEIEPDSVTGKAQAGWAFLKALAQLQDAGAADRRGVNWLLAAKAVIAAEKDDAALRLAEAKANAVLLRQRFDASLTEAAALIDARAWLDTRRATNGSPYRTDCWASVNERPRKTNVNCAFAAYVDAWNRGRLPAEVLAFREVQIEREFAVRRARAAAEKQYALASAGAATLRDYGAGGIMPATVAQTVIDLTTLGIIN